MIKFKMRPTLPGLVSVRGLNALPRLRSQLRLQLRPQLRPQAHHVSRVSWASWRSLSSTAPRRSSPDERQWSTPLAKQLAETISATGPVPLASYMRMCLTSDLGGYYTGAISGEGERDQFGLKGDFVTSPEISQVFGELIGIWFVAEWMSQGRPIQGVELIELGPGRGTLMNDMLRTLQSFPEMAHSIDAIYMVEASPELRMAQKNLLCGEDAPMTESKVGYHSLCKHASLPIVWTETVKSIPIDPKKTPFIVAHEFFDALPIHVFQNVTVPASQESTDTPASPPDHSSPSAKTSKPTLQWREMLVSPTPPGSTHESLRTPVSQRWDSPPPDFQLTLSKSPTRHSRYVPELSPRLRALRTLPDAVVEVCPDASLYAADMAARIGGSAKHPKERPSGAALILDYGPGDGTVPANTLRGIRRHRQVSPFVEPGLTDLSADVDFAAVAEEALKASEGVEVHGPVEQASFLEGMGIMQRAQMLLEHRSSAVQEGGDVKKASEPVSKILKACQRLIDRGPNGMGRIYKALAILPENDGKRRPVGFGGDVS